MAAYVRCSIAGETGTENIVFGRGSCLIFPLRSSTDFPRKYGRIFFTSENAKLTKLQFCGAKFIFPSFMFSAPPQYFFYSYLPSVLFCNHSTRTEEKMFPIIFRMQLVGKGTRIKHERIGTSMYKKDLTFEKK